MHFRIKAMNNRFERRTSARSRTSHFFLAALAAAGLGAISANEAQAQHSRHYDHQGHGEQAAKKRPVKKVPVRQRSSAIEVRGGHAGHSTSATDTPAVSEFKAAHTSMMQGMAATYTGDPDADFRIQMIPHHQGAIDMAEVAMRHAKDPWTRQLAEAVIVEQQREIAEMQARLAQRGIAAPQERRSTHQITASSYRVHDEEPGTRDEARGQSWAPGAGVPTRR